MARWIGMLLALAWTATAGAQAFPSKPIRVVITYPPGGSTDVVGRALAAKLTEGLGQQVVVDNRGGAGGIIGTDIVAHAAPDGYTVLLGTSAGMSINPLLHKKLPYNVQRDFVPVSLVVVNPQALVAHPAVAASNVQELIKLARAKPGQINYASPGVGSPNHMGMELLKSMTGINVVHVPYKGGGPAMTELLAGQVQLLFNSIPSVLPQVKAGRLKALAVGSARRSPAMPDVPTVAESGVPGYEYATWYGLFAPAGTPRPVVAILSKAVDTALSSPDLAQSLAAQGSEPNPGTPDQLARFMKAEHERWSRVVKAAGMTAE
ncbi:MAG TPA: tripartite tricarboxylate transporter substrate binding protein [Burkholderiales bacterium]|nr:tripartite tricarboxylate transporter substrate binding protein [Burkholderiales bacterium]